MLPLVLQSLQQQQLSDSAAPSVTDTDATNSSHPEQNGTEQNRTERNGTERNGTERNRTEQPGHSQRYVQVCVLTFVMKECVFGGRCVCVASTAAQQAASPLRLAPTASWSRVRERVCVCARVWAPSLAIVTGDGAKLSMLQHEQPLVVGMVTGKRLLSCEVLSLWHTHTHTHTHIQRTKCRQVLLLCHHPQHLTNPFNSLSQSEVTAALSDHHLDHTHTYTNNLTRCDPQQPAGLHTKPSMWPTATETPELSLRIEAWSCLLSSPPLQKHMDNSSV